jgi:hypothetical protein
MFTLVLALAVTVTSPAKVRDCSVALPSCGGVEGGLSHTAVGGFGSGEPLHGECKLCQDNGVPVNPTLCHTCQIELTETERAAYAKLLDAGSKGNLSEVVRLAAAVSKRVVYNRERGSIQIKAACDESKIVASLRLVTDEQRRMAMGLPDASTQMPRVVVGLQ